MTNHPDWDQSYAAEAPPPWDIGRPQPRFQALAEAGLLRGRVLDCGCGTGEQALVAAAHGADVRGIDVSARAIDQARKKATTRGLSAQFDVADVLTMPTPAVLFDVVIDSGVFHVFDDADRISYVAALRALVRPGGTCYLMCFSDRQPGDWGPRRVRAEELRSAFTDGWAIDLESATFDINPVDDLTVVQAWFATLIRAE